MAKRKKRGGGEQSASRLLLGKKRVGRQQGRDDETDPRSLFSLPCHCLHREMSTGKPKQEDGGESEGRGAVACASNVTINHYVVIAIDQQSPNINKRLFICVPAVTNIQNALFCYRCCFLLPLVSKGTSSIYQPAFRGMELKSRKGANQIMVLRPQAIATNHKQL